MTAFTEDHLERIGVLRDKADNFVHAGLLPMSAEIHKTALLGGMADIRDELATLYRELGGTE